MFKARFVSIPGCVKWPLSVLILATAFCGCATTQTKTQNDQMESRITDLEKNLQAKDAEIVDLQYQVKDLSSKMDSMRPGASDQVSVDAQEPAESVKVPEGAAVSSQLIRVKVSPEKVQRALKAAGVYTGPVDGKIGPATREAIIEFQKNHGLKADGVLGRKTWEELRTYLK